MAIPLAIGGYVLAEKAIVWGLITLGVVGTGVVVAEHGDEIVQGVGDAVGDATDAARCALGNCDDPECPPLVAKIDELLNRARPPGQMNGTKGIKQRYCEQNHGAMPPGSPGYATHTGAILGQQTGIVRRYGRAVARGCQMSPQMHTDVGRYGTRVPSSREYFPRPDFAGYCYGMAQSRREG